MIEWFRHDTDARNDIKIRKMLRDSDPGALGAYWMCVEILYQSGGYSERDNLAEELSFYGMEGYLDVLVSHELLEEVGNNVLTSQRVLVEINYQETQRQKKVDAGRQGGLKTQAKQRSSNAQAMPSSAKALSSTRQDNTIQDNTESSSYKNNSRLIRNTDDPCKLADTHKNASTSDEVPAAGSAGVAVTILSNKGEEVPIMENLVEIWEKAYPAVNVRAELQKIKSWSASNPTQRKTAQGMTRFCNNWLSKEQDKARIQPGNTIKGTAIGMSLVADGTREGNTERRPIFK